VDCAFAFLPALHTDRINLADLGHSLSDTNADSPSGTATLQQILNNVCPGQRYEFSAYIGQSDNIITGSKGETTAEGTLDGVPLFAPFYPCTPTSPCPFPGGSGPYGRVGPISIVPTSSTPVLKIIFRTTADPQFFSLDAFIDKIELTKVS
jgi:hypothetical protein